MASKLTNTSMLKQVAKRSYAAQAAAQAKSYKLPQHDVEVTTLPSGTCIASVENNSPISKVAVLFKAGSRYENPTNLGVSHALRRTVGLSTKGLSQFGIMRHSQQNGAVISVDGGKEHVQYRIDSIRDYLDDNLKILGELATKPTFKPWEVDSIRTSLSLDLNLRGNTSIALDNLHLAAFRSGLGNPLFISPHRIGGVSAGELSAYFSETHGAAGLAVVGMGVDHSYLVDYAKKLNLAIVKGQSSTGYKGGEIRSENGSSLAHVAVAGNGAGLSGQDYLALIIANHALGTGSTIKYGANSSSLLTAAVASAGGAGVASGLNVNYSDAGLFGYTVVADADSAGAIVKAVHKAVKSLNLTDADVANAKNKVKTSLLIAADSQDEAVNDLGLQALLLENYNSPTDIISKVNAVTTSAVNSAIKRALSGKLSMGAAGGLKTVPYVDEL